MTYIISAFSSVQSLSRVWLCDPMECSTPGIPVHHQLPELAQTHVHKLVMPSNHLILCRPLLLLPSIFPSIRVFSNESVPCIRWKKYWSFTFSFSPSNEHSGLISFRGDWLDLLAVKQTLKSLLQHQSSKASILWCSALFIVQLSHPYMTTGKAIALTRWTFVSKVLSLLFILALGYDIMIQYLYVLWNEIITSLTSITIPGYTIFFLVMTTSKIYSLRSFQIRNTALLTIVTPITYLFNWKFVPFDSLHPFHPSLTSGNY